MIHSTSSLLRNSILKKIDKKFKSVKKSAVDTKFINGLNIHIGIYKTTCDGIPCL